MAVSIPTLRVKPGCAFDRIAPGGFRILAALDAATKVLGQDLTLTAGTNDHTTGRHPLGEAYDLSVQTLTPAQIVRIVAFLRQTLGARFTVFYESPVAPSDTQLAAVSLVNKDASGPHLHLQIKKGTEYPPEGLVNA